MPGWPVRRLLLPGGPSFAALTDPAGALSWAACLVVPALLWCVARSQDLHVARLLRRLAVVAGVAGAGVVAGPAAVALGLWGGVLVLGWFLLNHPAGVPGGATPPDPDQDPSQMVPASPRGPEDAYRVLFEQHPSPMWVFDEETFRFVAVNDAVVDAYGYSRDALLTFTVHDVCPVEDTARYAAPTEAEPESPTWRHRTASGAVISTEVIFARLRVAGRPVRLVMVSEVTDRRRAEEALREREALLRSLLANIPCGVFWKDRASIYVGCNDQFAKDSGLASPGEAIGQTDYELALGADEAENSRTSDRCVIESGTALLNVEEIRTRGGGAKSVLLTSRVPMRDASGQVVGVLGVYQDVTDRKQLEERLRQAQKMEAIGRLAGGVAHDFNNLLTIIVCNAHLLRQLPRPDPALPQLVEDIQAAAERASGLTRQLLTFSRKQPIRAEVLDVTETVRGLAGLLRRLLGELVQVRTEFAPAPVYTRIDRGQLEQVVMNLAVNARDAMPGGGTVVLATAEVTAPGRDGGKPTRFVLFTLTDTGTGMTDEVKARMFEPFFTTKEVGKGTGLGLATVYGIVEQAGGVIEVESALGAGTRFAIRLPACDGSGTSTPAPRTLGGPLSLGRGQAVLLVEDEERIRRVARHTLEGQGYKVTEADRAETAMDFLGPGVRFDLLVTDLVMPGLDGRELATKVRTLCPEAGVVFISGYVPDSRRVDDLPGALFLPKPFTPMDLTRVVARAVGGSRFRHQATDGATTSG